MLEYALTEEKLRPCPDPERSTVERQPGNLWETVRQSTAAWKAEGAGTVVQNWIQEGARAEWANGPAPPVPTGDATDVSGQAAVAHRGERALH